MLLERKLNKYIFRGYDIRGVYPTDLNENVAYTIGKSFGTYVKNVCRELTHRKINYNDNLYYELTSFSDVSYLNIGISNINYEEHNDRYLKQCYYNLQEKADRGIITKEEWELIHKNIYGLIKSEVEWNE